MTDLIYIPDKTHGIAELDDASVVIGGNDSAKFVPNINGGKWSDEAWINLNPKWFPVEKSTVFNQTGGLFSLQNGGMKWQSYIDLNNRVESGFVFAGTPSFINNQIEFELLCSNGLRLCQQPSLEEEYASGVWPEHPTLDDFLKHAKRDDDVVGSIEVMYNKRNNQYKIGKLGIIYAPYFFDDDGNKIKLEMFLDGSSLIVDYSEALEWLKTAKFPITLDPELGFNDCLSTSYNAYFVRGTISATDATGGNIDTFYACVRGADADPGEDGIKLAVYDSDGTDISGQDLKEGVTGVIALNDAYSVAAVGTTALAPSTDYGICCIVQGSESFVRYTTGTGEASFSLTTEIYADMWKNPAVADYNNANRTWGFWVDYSPVVAGGVVPLVNAGLVNRGLVNGGLIN